MVSTSVLLSIKPKYVERIVNREKKFEFRKVIFKDRGINRVYIYSSSPIKKIVGFFVVGSIIQDKPENLWEDLKEDSGMKANDFFKYFSGKDLGFAIEINKFEEFKTPIEPKQYFSDFSAPQSFCYLDNSILTGINNSNGSHDRNAKSERINHLCRILRSIWRSEWGTSLNLSSSSFSNWYNFFTRTKRVFVAARTQGIRIRS